ncbi:MAG: adenylate/guanylate cyclase domain-containing protein [Actinomycetota bacterium]
MSDVTIEELHRRGISHPRARDDADLLAAVQHLLSLEVSLDEIEEHGIARMASARRVRERAWHGEEAAAALTGVGIDPEFSVRVRLAMGLAAGTGLGLTADELDATRFFAGVRNILGEEDTLSMVRVIGNSSARIARATAAMLRVNFETPIDHSPAPLAEAVAAYTQLIDSSLPTFLDATATLIRRHLAAFVADDGWEMRVDETRSAALQQIVVGFADLVGFTAFTEASDAEQFMDVMGRFESEVQEIVVANGGTVVKMIGDEVMFVTQHSDEAVRIARQLTRVCRYIAGLDGMRVGLSRGEVINSGGDYYGTVVNIASRIVGMSFADAIVATEAVVDGLPSTVARTELGPHDLRGISTPVNLFRIDRARAHGAE